MDKINTRKLLLSIKANELPEHEKPAAIEHLVEEIFQCDEVIKDPETEFHVRREYKGYRSQYNIALTKLKSI